MKQMKLQSFFLLFILHQCLCQQSSQQYSQHSQQSTQQYGQTQSTQQYTTPNQNKVQLEDIERDTLKSTQPQSSSQPSHSQQYLSYPQDQLIYSIPPQQAIYQTPQQPVPSVYAAQPTTTPLVGSPQQQFYVQPYYMQPAQVPQSYPYVDFGGFPIYQSVYPYVVPQTNAPAAQVPPNVVADYFKTLQQPPQVKTAIQPAVKSPSAQVPTVGNYVLSNTLPNAYYQPVSFTQPQNPQYYSSYNSFYQVQNPQKSVYSAGIKSTTPSAPVKGKDDQFVPISNGNYRYDFATAEQNNYNKVRLSG